MRENKENEKGGPVIRMYNVGEYYKIFEKVGRGTYGTVYKVRGLRDNKFYAIKKLENNDVKLQQEGFPITALRGTIMIVSEITLLKQIDHPNIIKLKEIILSRPSKRNLFRGSTFLVFQYMDHDFAGLFKMRRKFNLPEIKCIFKQLIEGVAYLHKNKILHRDIKSANILLNDDGDVKLADFGLGRKIRLENVFTYKVVTLWYRAPELLWGFKHYSDKIDVWSIGCVAVEFFTGEVLFKKESQHAQIERIYEICGDFQANDLRISEEAAKSYQYLADMRPKKPYKKDIANYLRKMCPNISEITIEFIEGLLHLDPNKRLSCEEALRHPFFNEKPTACLPRQIEKQEYECHEMFKDRSIKIQRKKEQQDALKIKASNKEDRGFRQYHPKRQKENSITSESKNRQFSSSGSSSNGSSDQSQSYHHDKSKRSRSSRSKSRQARKRSKSREETRRHGYHERKHRERDIDSRRQRNYHREVREERKDRRDENREYKIEKDRRVQDKEDKYYRQREEKQRFKQARRKDDRYDRYEERIDERRQAKDDRRPKDDRREGKHERRPIKDDRHSKEDRRQVKEDRRQVKEDRRDIKDDRRDIKEDRRDVKDDRREAKDDRRDAKDERRDKDERRAERHHEYKRDSKQKKYDKYQKGKYESRPYEAKGTAKHRSFEDQKDYKRRQQRRPQRRQDREKGRQERDKHQNGKYQASKQKYSGDYRSDKKPEKFMFIRQKGHRKKSDSSSSSPSSYSNHHFKKQKQHRSKYSYDRKAYYKKQHSSSGSRGYH